MGQHKHNQHCIALTKAREFAYKITGQQYSEKWIYNQKELETYFCGEKGDQCIDIGILEQYVRRRKIVPEKRLRDKLKFAGKHRILQAEIARESGVKYQSIWRYSTRKEHRRYKLTQANYDKIASAIDRLVERKRNK